MLLQKEWDPELWLNCRNERRDKNVATGGELLHSGMAKVSPFFLAIVQVAPLANLDASTPHEAFMWLLASAGFWLPMIL